MRELRRLLTIAVAAAPVVAGAQPRTDVYLAPLVSIQPDSVEPPRFGRPFGLDKGISGTEPGLALGITHRTNRGVVLGLELSTTTKMSVEQSGGLVFYASGAACSQGICGPVTAQHTDTLLSLLAGGRFRWDTVALELVAGPSLVFGTPQQGALAVDDAAGRWALGGGANAVIPLGERVDLSPSFRYAYVFRGENVEHIGLGSHIFRIGLVLRVRVGS
jgi:hypothetical protein